MTLKELYKEIKEDLSRKVSLDRFSPVEKLVYGFTGLLLVSIVVMWLNYFIKS